MPTNKYDLHTIEYSVQGWDSIMNTDMMKLDSVIHTVLIGTLGEAIEAKKAVYLSRVDGKYYKAKADRSRQPALGITLESGAIDDQVRIQRVGPISDTNWSWSVGKPVFLSPDIPGELTQATTPPESRQLVGIASALDTVLLVGTINLEALPSTTTTTTTTTTSSSTTTSTTTTTSSSTTTSTTTTTTTTTA